MSEWMIWAIFAGVLVVLEMFTGTFYLLMIGVGLAAGAAAAFVGTSTEMQLLIAALVGASATYGLCRSGLGRISRREVRRDPNVNLDIGQTLTVDAWNGADNGPPTARVMYRGALWDVELEHGAEARPGMFLIREVRGSRLIVTNAVSARRQP